MGTPHSAARKAGSFLANAGLRTVRWVVLALAALLPVTAARANTLNITVDGSQTFQTIDGFGVNANHRSFTNNEITPVLDALIDQAGMTLFRVVFDNADWEQTNDNSNASVMNWGYYNTIYSSPDFQKMWNMMAYLNQKGLTNGVMPNFQGFGPSWMGGLSLTPGMEDEWAEMVASALVYARKTNHLQFSLVAPNNEPNLPGSGIGIADGQQYALTLHKLSQQLDANGMSDIRFVGPDLSDGGTNWMPDIMADPLVMSKLAHFGIHSYSDYGTWSYKVSDFLQQSPYPNSTFWMTEYNVWCDTCQASIAGTNTWDYARGSAEYLLYHLANNASAGLVWEAYDSLYFNNFDSNTHWSYWGLFAVNDINATPKTYTPRKAFYTLSQISKFVRPGAKRIALSGVDSSMLLVAFYQPDTQQITITGINYDSSPSTLSGTLNSLPGLSALNLYYTSASANLTQGATTPVANGTFSATIPGDSVFTLTGIAGANIVISTQPTNQYVKSGGTATLSVQATGTSALSYQWQRNKVNISGATNASLTLNAIKPLNAHDAGTYDVIVSALGASLTSSNAVLLVDQRNPTLTIASPKPNTRLTIGTTTVSGTAADDTRVTAVLYQLNGSAWTPVNGTSNWSASVPPPAGSNLFRAYATDPVGNHSPTGSVTVTYVVNSPLTLLTNGLGGITGKSSGSILQIGSLYTVTATPKAGQIFSSWSGSVTSLNATLTFQMQSNLVLQANFVPNPFLPVAGTYNGLFSETNRVHGDSGFFTLALTTAGSYSARLQIGTGSYSTSGKFAANGAASQSIARKGMTTLNLAMTLDLVGGQLLSGTVGDGTWSADVMAERSTFNSKTNPATQFAGRYNFLIPGGDDTGLAFPEGDGYGTLSIDTSGKVTLGGSLADSTALAQTITVSADGNIPLYVPLYAGVGSLLGWLSFDTNQPATNVQGLLSWIKPAQRAAYYPGGFTNLILSTGSRYVAPPGTTTPVLPMTNGVVLLDGGNLTNAVTNLIFFTSSNKLQDRSVTNKLAFSLTVSNGIFKGTMVPAGTVRSIPFQGVISQDLGAGYGYFLGPSQSGRVYFGP